MEFIYTSIPTYEMFSPPSRLFSYLENRKIYWPSVCFTSPSDRYLASCVRLERLHDTELELKRSLLLTEPVSGGLNLCPRDKSAGKKH